MPPRRSGPLPPGHGVTAASPGQDILAEISRCESLMKTGCISLRQFKMLVDKLLPTNEGEAGNTMAQLTETQLHAYARADQLEAMQALQAQEAAAAAGLDGVAGETMAHHDALDELNAGAGPDADADADLHAAAAAAAHDGGDPGFMSPGSAAGGGDVIEDPEFGPIKKKRTYYKWTKELEFDSKEQAKEHIKTLSASSNMKYVLKHGKNNDIVYQCKTHSECPHHFRVFPLDKGPQWQLMTSGEHNNAPPPNPGRGVKAEYRKEVDPMLRQGWTPLAVLRHLQSIYKGVDDLPTADALQNRKKTLQRVEARISGGGSGKKRSAGEMEGEEGAPVGEEGEMGGVELGGEGEAYAPVEEGGEGLTVKQEEGVDLQA